MHHWLVRSTVLALTALTLGVSPTTAEAKPDATVALLPSEATADRRKVAGSHCLSIEPRQLDCYATAHDRDVAIERRMTLASSALASGYVVAYENISYGGASVVLSGDQPNLGSIGWNNRISSYKVFTSATGYFHQGLNYAGLAQSYCCFSTISYVGNSFNDTFSSFSLP